MGSITDKLFKVALVLWLSTVSVLAGPVYTIKLDVQRPDQKHTALTLYRNSDTTLRVILLENGASYTDLDGWTGTFNLFSNEVATAIFSWPNISVDTSLGAMDIKVKPFDIPEGDYDSQFILTDGDDTIVYGGTGTTRVRGSPPLTGADEVNLTSPINWSGKTYLSTQADGPYQAGTNISFRTESGTGKVFIDSEGGGTGTGVISSINIKRDNSLQATNITTIDFVGIFDVAETPPREINISAKQNSIGPGKLIFGLGSGQFDLTDFTEVSRAELAAGRVLVANSTTYNSRAISGDLTLNANGVATIGAGSVGDTKINFGSGVGQVNANDIPPFRFGTLVDGQHMIARGGIITNETFTNPPPPQGGTTLTVEHNDAVLNATAEILDFRDYITATIQAGNEIDIAVTPRFKDSEFKIIDNTDPTKTIRFGANQITTGTERQLTVPNTSGTIALLDVNQNYKNRHDYHVNAATVVLYHANTPSLITKGQILIDDLVPNLRNAYIAYGGKKEDGTSATELMTVLAMPKGKFEAGTDGQIPKLNSAGGVIEWADPPTGGGGGGGSMDNLADDTTPQLGGQLDMAGFSVTDASDAKIDIADSSLNYTSRVVSGLWILSDGLERKIGDPGTDVLATAIAQANAGDTLLIGAGVYTETATIAITVDNLTLRGVAARPVYNWPTTPHTGALQNGAVIKLAERITVAAGVSGLQIHNLGLWLDNIGTAGQDVLLVNDTGAINDLTGNLFSECIFLASQTNAFCIRDQSWGSTWRDNIVIGGLEGQLMRGNHGRILDCLYVDNRVSSVIIKGDGSPTAGAGAKTVENIQLSGLTFKADGVAEVGGLKILSINGATTRAITAQNILGENLVNLWKVQQLDGTSFVRNISIDLAYGKNSSSHMYWNIHGNGIMMDNVYSAQSADDGVRVGTSVTNFSLHGGRSSNHASDALQLDGHALFAEMNGRIYKGGAASFTTLNGQIHGSNIIAGTIVSNAISWPTMPIERNEGAFNRDGGVFSTGLAVNLTGYLTMPGHDSGSSVPNKDGVSYIDTDITVLSYPLNQWQWGAVDYHDIAIPKTALPSIESELTYTPAGGGAFQFVDHKNYTVRKSLQWSWSDHEVISTGTLNTLRFPWREGTLVAVYANLVPNGHARIDIEANGFFGALDQTRSITGDWFNVIGATYSNTTLTGWRTDYPRNIKLRPVIEVISTSVQVNIGLDFEVPLDWKP